MTIRDALRSARIDPLDAELLLAHALGTPREHLLAHPEERVRPSRLGRFRRFVARRRKHEPVALILGHKHFYDLTLAVRRGVLIPRPETELLVDEALAAATAAGDAERGPPAVRSEVSTVGVRSGRTRRVIVDVGTGSGAIALALARHLYASASSAAGAVSSKPSVLPGTYSEARRHGDLAAHVRTRAVIIATDLSFTALRLAQKNARMLGLSKRVRFVRADMLPREGGETPPLQPIIVVANLPYLPTAVWRSAPPDVKRFEPRSALDGGRDGLDAYRALFAHVAHIYTPRPTPSPLTIIIEIDPSQKRILPNVIKRFFPKAATTFKKDLAGRWRLAVLRLRP